MTLTETPGANLTMMARFIQSLKGHCILKSPSVLKDNMGSQKQHVKEQIVLLFVEFRLLIPVPDRIFLINDDV